jgi:two-component system, chemotaxis family, chemotaxis protein CheY
MSLNVLIVDDSGVGRMMIAKALKLSGIEIGQIHQAANGQEGLNALAANWVDLIFADINMPVMNGEEMIEKIRANPLWVDIPIVVVSTEGSQTRVERLEQKCRKFIHKPFSPEMVREVIREVTGVCHEQGA